ncbi:hypothetical protein TUM4442_09140 [Shewanella algae]|uniref:hypothetical protein n=1 Tax=Shewanella algae TaxID=38313 RepID=UPI001BED6C1D|nr:hypothetical protein TUM4442_09140 [Shewanella algae]
MDDTPCRKYLCAMAQESAQMTQIFFTVFSYFAEIYQIHLYLNLDFSSGNSALAFALKAISGQAS